MLIKELQSLCLDIRALDENMNEIHLKDSSEEEEESSMGLTIKDDAAFIDIDLNDDDDDVSGDEELDDFIEDDMEEEPGDDFDDSLEDEFEEDFSDEKGDFVDDLDLL